MRVRLKSKLDEAFKSVNEFYGVIAGWNGEKVSARHYDTVKKSAVSPSLSGNGRLELTDGWSYLGEYVTGLFHGYGEIFKDDELIYAGQFYDGHFHGHGKIKYHADFAYLFEETEWSAYFG